MAYVKIPILYAAELCGVELDRRTAGRTEVEAICPFCTSLRHAPHLYMNTDYDVYRCYKCGAKGNSITLYARCFGVDNKEAYRQLKSGGGFEALSGYGPQPAAEAYLAPSSLRHDVYFDMLDMLALEQSHLNDLLHRGFSHDAVRERFYRSMPGDWRIRRNIAMELAKRYDLRGVPGFFTREGEWNLAGKDSLLIPVCTREGYIQGLQMRYYGDEKKKYRWLSSNPKYNYENGTAAKSWIHVAGNTGLKTAHITESGLKGELASYLSGGLLFVCVPGVGNIEYLTSSLAGLGVTSALGCYDMDMNQNGNVLAAQIQMESAISVDLGLNCPAVRWNPAYKGVDDYWLARRSWQNQADEMQQAA